MVVVPLKDTWLDITDQVLEEGTDHHIDDLTNDNVNLVTEGGPRMELLEVKAAGNILLRCLEIQLVQSEECILLLVDGLSEVERHIVHQERLELLLQPWMFTIGVLKRFISKLSIIGIIVLVNAYALVKTKIHNAIAHVN